MKQEKKKAPKLLGNLFGDAVRNASDVITLGGNGAVSNLQIAERAICFVAALFLCLKPVSLSFLFGSTCFFFCRCEREGKGKGGKEKHTMPLKVVAHLYEPLNTQVDGGGGGGGEVARGAAETVMAAKRRVVATVENCMVLRCVCFVFFKSRGSSFGFCL